VLTVLLEDPAQREATPEPVLLSQVLAHPVNAGYHGARNVLVEEVDGRPVRGLASLRDLVGRADGGRFIELRNRFGGYLVLDRAAARAAHAEVLRTYRVPRDRSEDLLPEAPAPAER
jgi:hypothetical protein